MLVAEAAGLALARAGVDCVFGVVGSGNFHITNGLIAGGARFVAARAEGGATTMADAYARQGGRVGVASVHQGPGLTNAMTGLTEAAKSRTPLLVLAAQVTAPGSNFFIDQAALASAVGAVPMLLDDPASAVAALHFARTQRRTVLLNMPLEAQHAEFLGTPPGRRGSAGKTPTVIEVEVPPPSPKPADLEALAQLLAASRRPVFIAGRGAREARAELTGLAARAGALLATSAVVRGLFNGDPYSLDVSGGFASPLAVELITAADLIVGWGCALNMWTMRHGTLVGPGAQVVQVDLDDVAIGAQRPVDLGVVGDVGQVASLLSPKLKQQKGYRTPAVRRRIAEEIRWRDVPFDDDSTSDRIDARALTIGLDDLLPAQRVVAVDSGNFMGYPSMYLSVPDPDGFCFTQAYMSIGLGLATAIGAALAQPDRLPVAACGDGGFLMAVAELDTVVRLGLPMVVIVYNDDAYGAEVHHFGPHGYPLDTVRFPETDIAAIARGFGCAGVTVRTMDDVGAVRSWLAGPRSEPIVIDAKVTTGKAAWWLEEAFRGH